MCVYVGYNIESIYYYTTGVVFSLATHNLFVFYQGMELVGVAVPPPLGKDAGIMLRLQYSFACAVVASSLSTTRLVGQAAFVILGYGLFWSWQSHFLVRSQAVKRKKAGKRRKRKKKGRKATDGAPVLNINYRPGATKYPEKRVVYEHSFDNVVKGVWKKLREPLPDPKQPDVLKVETTVVSQTEKYEVRRRVFTLKNEEEVPWALKFLSKDIVTFEEDSLLDVENKTLTFVTVNGDFKEYGQILDVQVYQPDPSNPKHTLMVETGEVSMPGVPGFVRSKAESMVVDGFNEKFQIAVDFFTERLAELYPNEGGDDAASAAAAPDPAVPPCEGSKAQDDGVPSSKVVDEKLFDSATSRVRKEKSLSSAQKVDFYGLFKQATVGDNKGARPSGFTDPVGAAKWDGWKKYQGISSDDAKKKYIDLLAGVSPNWQTP
jgi:acyl-CoA-binding protein